jgi:hypothetical protein
MVPSSEEGERELALVARLTKLVVHPVLREGGRAGGGEGGREGGREGGMTGMTTGDATGSNGSMTIEHHGCSDIPPSLPPSLPPCCTCLPAGGAWKMREASSFLPSSSPFSPSRDGLDRLRCFSFLFPPILPPSSDRISSFDPPVGGKREK